MSSIGLPGLDALLRGAIIGGVVAPVGLWLAWRVAAGLTRWRRVGLAAAAGYGGLALLSGSATLIFERADVQDEAVFGALIVGALVLVLAAPILAFFTPRS
jgi:hypothetical protein